MLLILMMFLIIASILVVIVKRNKESFYLFGMCISLAIMLTGILLYIAKKGGISRELQTFFFFNNGIKMWIQYFQITLDHLGLMIAIGRSLFPLFLLLLAFHYSMPPWLARNYWLRRMASCLPVFLIILYHPVVFRLLTHDNEAWKQVIMLGINGLFSMYLLVSIILLVIEAHSIQMNYFRRKFIWIISFILSLSLLYLLYFGQDPSQVYQLYSYKNGIYYLNSVLSVPAYILIVIVNLFLAIIGSASLIKYTHDQFEANREEITIQRKFEAISTGTAVFVHSIKNQLLANRVVFKRIHGAMQDGMDVEKLKGHIDTLSQQNENILQRIEELYRSVKTNVVHLIPVALPEVIDSSLERFQQKYPDKQVEVQVPPSTMILADKVHLSEAIYNLLTNAQEAVNGLDDGKEERVSVHCYNTSEYTVIEVKDSGIGIGKKEAKKIFEPFYSNKNTNQNWGMGLHYVRTIVKEHFGNLRFESEEGKGSTFYVLLPNFKG
ncbi:sensor histidine kinase [Neobacillus citreus]|uniref:histidine kinase n=1 Tax=Neobacillus citreus TaxID=2833578 RepID=A0A942T2P5_9BACI|nr:HAMP domain-containing sensor histidine kinase [Neobacillus citreus]MCH6267204.1 HAMP domain-containing histidine kinase [Neobacillus citreus]